MPKNYTTTFIDSIVGQIQNFPRVVKALRALKSRARIGTTISPNNQPDYNRVLNAVNNFITALNSSYQADGGKYDLSRMTAERAFIGQIVSLLNSRADNNCDCSALMDLYDREAEKDATKATSDKSTKLRNGLYNANTRYKGKNIDSHVANLVNTNRANNNTVFGTMMRWIGPGAVRDDIEQTIQDETQDATNRGRVSTYSKSARKTFGGIIQQMSRVPKVKSKKDFYNLRGMYGSAVAMRNYVDRNMANGAAKKAVLKSMDQQLASQRHRFGNVLNAKDYQSFKDNERKNNKRNDRRQFLSDLLSGIGKIMQKNVFGDIMKWLFLLLGKNHPVLAALLLTLTSVVPILRGIKNAFVWLKGAVQTVTTAMTVLGDTMMTAALIIAGSRGFMRGLRGKGSYKTPQTFRRSVLNPKNGGRSNFNQSTRGNNSWFNKWMRDIRAFTLKSSMRGVRAGRGQTRRLAQLTTQLGWGPRAGITLSRGTRALTSRLPIIGGAIDFGFNKLAGQSNKEAGMRAAGSSLGGWAGLAAGGVLGAKVGGALGTLIGGPVGTAVGAVVGGAIGILGGVIGGLFGDWIGGKLFRKMDKEDEKLKQVEENTSWLGRIWEWIKNKFGGKDNNDPDNNKNYGDPTKTETPEQNKKQRKYTEKEVNAAKKELDDLKVGSKKFDKKLWELQKKYADEQLGGYDNTKGETNIGYVRRRDELAKSDEAKDYAIRALADRAKELKGIVNSGTATLDKNANYGTAVVTTPMSNKGDVNGKTFMGRTITSGYGWRYHPKGTGSSADGKYHFHGGLDLSYREGEAIGAFKGGTIVDIGYNKGGYGNVVKVMDEAGNIHQYAHGSKFGNFKKGDKVNAGDVIMYAGHTGFATGPHLDYRVLDKKTGKWVNPQTGELANASANLAKVSSDTSTQVQTQSLQLASNGLRTALNERTGGGKPGDTENQRLERTRRMIFSATDVTGSMGVWGITHLNNHGGMYVGGKGGR